MFPRQSPKTFQKVVSKGSQGLGSQGVRSIGCYQVKFHINYNNALIINNNNNITALFLISRYNLLCVVGRSVSVSLSKPGSIDLSLIV